MTISAAEVLCQFTATQVSGADFGSPTATPSVVGRLRFTDGTTANKADILFTDQRSVNASSNDDIDLAGSLSDAFGSTITAAEMVALIIINAPASGSANVSDLTIGGGSNPFVGFLGGTTPTIGPIKPGGMVCIAAGDAAGIGAVTAGTGDILRVANGSGGTAVYQIAFLARTA